MQSQGTWAPLVGCAGFCEAALGGSQGQGIREDGSPSLKLFPVCTSCGSCARLMGFCSLLPHRVKNLFLPIIEGSAVEISSFKMLCQSWVSLGDKIFPGFPVGFPLEIHGLLGLPWVPQLGK